MGNTTTTNAAIAAAKEDGISFATKFYLIKALMADGFNLAVVSRLPFVERNDKALRDGWIQTQRSSYAVTSGLLHTQARNMSSYKGKKVTVVLLGTTRNGSQELLVKLND